MFFWGHILKNKFVVESSSKAFFLSSLALSSPQFVFRFSSFKLPPLLCITNNDALSHWSTYILLLTKLNSTMYIYTFMHSLLTPLLLKYYSWCCVFYHYKAEVSERCTQKKRDLHTEMFNLITPSRRAASRAWNKKWITSKLELSDLLAVVFQMKQFLDFYSFALHAPRPICLKTTHRKRSFSRLCKISRTKSFPECFHIN